MKTLKQIIDENRDDILASPLKVLLLKDTNAHHAILYEDKGRIALQFQEEYSPIVYPEMHYDNLGFVNVKEALKKLEGL